MQTLDNCARRAWQGINLSGKRVCKWQDMNLSCKILKCFGKPGYICDTCKTRLFCSNNLIFFTFSKNFVNKVYKIEILICLFSSLCIFISFIGHYGVHSVLKQCIEEIFRVISGWIKETFWKAIIRCNQWSRIDFMPFLSNCVIVFIFSVI